MEIVEFENEIRKIIYSAGCFAVLEYERDASVTAATAAVERMKSSMGVRRRQLMIKLNGKNSVTMEAGAMQWTAGNIFATAGVSSPGDYVRKWVHSALTKESAVKPEYSGVGIIALEPTYHHIILENVGDYGPDGMIISDGMFLAHDENVHIETTARRHVSSVLAGNEGLFNTNLIGNGIVALKSSIPYIELMKIRLNDEELKLDGSFAIAWSKSLEFTVGKSSSSWVGSAINKEGLVNIYSGTGTVLISPVAATHMMLQDDDEQDANPVGKHGPEHDH